MSKREKENKLLLNKCYLFLPLNTIFSFYSDLLSCLIIAKQLNPLHILETLGLKRLTLLCRNLPAFVPWLVTAPKQADKKLQKAAVRSLVCRSNGINFISLLGLFQVAVNTHSDEPSVCTDSTANTNA